MATKVLAAAVVAVSLVAGVFFFGRLADDPNVAMGLTAGWFVAGLAAGYAVGRRRPGLRLPMAAAFGAVALAVTVLVGLPTVRDRQASERVVRADAPARSSMAAGQGRPGPAAVANRKVAEGSFVSLAHPGRGTATAVELPNGQRRLTLRRFETDSGPDLRLYVTARDPSKGGEPGAFRDLGALKGNRGDQQYVLPRNLDLRRYPNVVVWCRAFSVGFASARLRL